MIEYDHTWTHPICRSCYEIEEPGRRPHRVKGGEHAERCCWCNKVTRLGIYYRRNPEDVHG